jgi:hypothetical protein
MSFLGHTGDSDHMYLPQGRDSDIYQTVWSPGGDFRHVSSYCMEPGVGISDMFQTGTGSGSVLSPEVSMCFHCQCLLDFHCYNVWYEMSE